jgi:hypothetical protein
MYIYIYIHMHAHTQRYIYIHIHYTFTHKYAYKCLQIVSVLVEINMLLYSCCIRLMQILDVQIQTDEFRWLHKVCRWDLKHAVATAEPSLF